MVADLASDAASAVAAAAAAAVAAAAAAVAAAAAASRCAETGGVLLLLKVCDYKCYSSSYLHPSNSVTRWDLLLRDRRHFLFYRINHMMAYLL